MSSLKKKLTSSKETVDLNMYKTSHFKTTNTVSLYYLAFNAFYVGFFSEIIFILFKIIIVNIFL